MVIPNIDRSQPALSGSNIYTGWFLTFGVDETTLWDELGISRENELSGAAPRLMLIRLGDKGAFKVSPVTGKILGFEIFGVRPTNNDILRDPVPKPTGEAALYIPLHLPYHPMIFAQDTGEVECREKGFRHIGYRVAGTRTGDRFRVQLFRAGSTRERVRIATDVIVGIDDEGAISDIWLDRVQHAQQPDLPFR